MPSSTITKLLLLLALLLALLLLLFMATVGARGSRSGVRVAP